MKKPLMRTCLCALFAALLCVLSPIALPIGPIPVSLSLAVLLLSAASLGAFGAFLSTMLYLSLGALGLPVFAGGMGGFGVLLGPTGGFLLAYPIVAFLCGLTYRAVFTTARVGKGARFFLGILAGLPGVLICYVLGCAHYTVVADVPVWSAIAVTVLPFVLFDLLKLAALSWIVERILPVKAIHDWLK